MNSSRWRQLNRWYLDHRTGVLDLVALGFVVVLIVVLVVSTDVGTKVVVLAARHPEFHLFDLVVSLAFLLLFVALFAWRRWREVSGLLEDADTDPLTGLNNRRKIARILRQEFDRALRYDRPLSLVMFDIDHFKQVNDSHGHPVGDAVLSTLSRRVRRKMRLTDHLGRWGGEEFILICPETDTLGAMRIADRMRRTIKQRPMLRAGTVTASFGVSSHRGEGDFEVLLEQADHYLYLAKQHGRDRVVSRYTVLPKAEARDETLARNPVVPREFRKQLTSLLMSTISAVTKNRS